MIASRIVAERFETCAVSAPKSITILGSTGSIGRSTVDLILAHKDSFVVEALTAFSNVDLLARQARDLKPKFVAIGDPSFYEDLKTALSGTGIEIAAGDDAVVEAARRPAQMVMAGIVGVAGLKSTMAAVERGAVIAFANKECLVSAGTLMLQKARAAGAVLMPVDSEHNAIFQVFDEKNRDAVVRLILTASGGPFLRRARGELDRITPEEAIRHPNWSMGAKISVDSATMMNKALEVIEAHYLFDMPSEKIDVLIHPQSVVHSMVEYSDGSILAQMGAPDMRTPISYALAWPQRIKTTGKTLDLSQRLALEFEPPDLGRFPMLTLAREALKLGGGAPTILNTANEAAVAAFLNRKIGFLDIERVIELTLQKVKNTPVHSLDDVYALTGQTREMAHSVILKI